MKTKEIETLKDIQSGQLRQAYLLYGEEAYLRSQYRDRLRDALCADGDEMNVHRFSGKDIPIQRVIELAQTMPFFAERRVIFIEDSGLFRKGGEELADYLAAPAPTAWFVFVETEVDRRSRLYKAVSKLGRAEEFTTQDEDTLRRWILGRIQREGKKVSGQALALFLERAGTDMEQICRELEKVFCYTMERDAITEADVDAVCVRQITGQIFDMVHAIAEQNRDKTLALYYDLLALREPPLRILFLIAREFDLLMQVRQLRGQGCDNGTISEKTGLRPYFVGKYIAQSSRFSPQELRQAVTDCVELETAVKTGTLDAELGVEMLILYYASGRTGGKSGGKEKKPVVGGGQNDYNRSRKL